MYEPDWLDWEALRRWLNAPFWLKSPDMQLCLFSDNGGRT